jgi:copper chaperone CopZ
MKFATPRQIVVLTAIVCAVLFGLDYYKNPQLWHAASERTAKPGVRLALWMNHLCCTGCLADIRQALAGLPGVDLENATGPEQLLPQAEANLQTTSVPDNGNLVELPITDLEKLDLVAIDRALRNKGFVAGRMELSGVEHFRLEALLEHLCCGMCDRSIREQIAFLKSKGAAGQLKWMDSFNVEPEKKTVVAYARFLEPGKTVDVAEFLSGLNYLGYEPSSLRIVSGEEMGHTHDHVGE